MALYPDFLPAKRADTPPLAYAAAMQGQLDQGARAQRDQKMMGYMKAPIDLYTGYAEATDDNFLGDWMKSKFGSSGSGASTQITPNVPVGADPMAQTGGFLGGGASNAAEGTMGIADIATAMPSSAVVNSGTQAGTQVGTKVAEEGAKGFLGKAGSALPVVGPVVGAAAGALGRQGQSQHQQIAGGVGGGAGGALMSFAPAMAAAGPVGWAGMAGLAALSLYGMLA